MRSAGKGGELDYSRVSEAPGIRVTREAVSMLRTRYAFAARFCRGKDVLEVACGTGLGLGVLARYARGVVGGDYTDAMLRLAQRHYRGRVPLVRLDAHTLPFTEASFDVVILFEAIYYLARPQEFLRECCRVLRPEGILLLCSANKEWEGFSPSWLSWGYFSAREMRELLNSTDFDVEVFGAFPNSNRSWSRRTISKIRKLGARMGLIPSTMKRKEILKRLFYGPLVLLGAEADGDLTDAAPLFPVGPNDPSGEYKVLYAVGKLKSGVFVNSSQSAP